LFFKGVISKWIAFAKSLKLKIMMRDFNTYKTQISSLLSAGGLLEENCAVTTFEDATNKGNPLYEYNIRQLNTTENIRACHTLCEFLLNYSDPRIENIYELTAVASGKIAKGETLTYAQKYEGLPCGTKPPTSGNGSVPLTNSSKFKESFSDPVYLMNDAEAEFLIAEAYARIGDSGKAKTYYDKGVTKSFDRWKESASKASTFITDGGAYAFNASTTETMVKSIMTQKWISYAKANALDGVFDRNRTGYPSIDPSSVVRVSDSDRSKGLTSGYILGTLVAPGATTLQPSEFPRRLLVPDASAQYNVNAPKTKALGVPMWWQVASGK
ncbi:MAG TPA: SusD/RagB family nutrient-binding outer membrane lipoprotein, partial [Prolixibacteraceae bacterium]|nr:SusD/RagB family nutrient-binding outer membrane lipoprotein [Prolixibacteraceae bacterium]